MLYVRRSTPLNLSVLGLGSPNVSQDGQLLHMLASLLTHVLPAYAQQTYENDLKSTFQKLL